MNEELQQQLAALLQSLLAFSSDAKEFAAQQIPPLVQEKIALGRAEESIYFAGSVAIALVLVWLSLTYWKRAWAATVENDAPVIGLNFAGLAGAFFFSTANLHAMLLVWFAPRLYIVEWLKSMVTK